MLYVCPTPIGNLEDVTLRVLDVLERADIIACEDTRRTKVLLDRYDIEARLLSFYEHNEEKRIGEILSHLQEGREVALVTDAGMPGLSDPGFSLVRACVEAGYGLTVLPGASAVSTALVASAMPTDRFLFVGFLPRGSRKLVAAIEEADAVRASIVAFESPRRLAGTLEAIGRRWPDRRVAVCRELTKVHEGVLRGTASEVKDALGGETRGEVVLVLAPAADGEAEATAGPAGVPREALDLLARSGLGTKEAARVVSLLTGLSRRESYGLLTPSDRAEGP